MFRQSEVDMKDSEEPMIATKVTYADKVKSQASLIQMVKQEQNESIKKENRVIVFGLPNSKDTEKKDIDDFNQKLVDKLLNDLKVDKKKVAQFFRLKSKPTGDDKSKEDNSTPLVIQMKNKDEKLNVLKIAKNLRTIDGYDKVYINNDLTSNERNLMKQLIKERDELNEKENTKDDKCNHFYGIRNFEIKKIQKKNTK
jgi:hypothetical protein